MNWNKKQAKASVAEINKIKEAIRKEVINFNKFADTYHSLSVVLQRAALKALEKGNEDDITLAKDVMNIYDTMKDANKDVQKSVEEIDDKMRILANMMQNEWSPKN